MSQFNICDGKVGTESGFAWILIGLVVCIRIMLHCRACAVLHISINIHLRDFLFRIYVLFNNKKLVSVPIFSSFQNETLVNQKIF
jgi:hypothetical protein